MKIAVFGWGSLIWDSRDFKNCLELDIWNTDGPRFRIEFARISRDGRITLVLVDNPLVKEVIVLWNILKCAELTEAREHLAKREGCGESDISFIERDSDIHTESGHSREAVEISNWLVAHEMDAAIWTGLRSNLQSKRVEFSAQGLIRHLKSLSPRNFKAAKEYILRTPKQVDTKFGRDLVSFLRDSSREM